MKAKLLIPNGRLAAAASFVRTDAAVADVGCDHAYLAIELVLSGRAKSVVATDIREGPVERARANVAAYGLCDRITVVRADGLCGVERYAPNDIIIAGMGGELIAEIIAASDYVKNTGVRLILQPMTKAETLRAYLCANGFDIIDEALAREERRIYQIICCRFDGVTRAYSPLELYAGRRNLEQRPPLLKAQLSKIAAQFEKRRRGKLSAGESAAEEEEMLCGLTSFMNTLKS